MSILVGKTTRHDSAAENRKSSTPRPRLFAPKTGAPPFDAMRTTSGTPIPPLTVTKT
jgi:hypothetical protein